MRENGIRSVQTPKFIETTDSDHALGYAPNLLNQNFGVDAPDCVWVGDITCVWMRISPERGHPDRRDADTEIAVTWTARSPLRTPGSPHVDTRIAACGHRDRPTWTAVSRHVDTRIAACGYSHVVT